MKKIFLIIVISLIVNINDSKAEVAENAISFQPLGFFFAWTNFEYENKLTEVSGKNALALCGRVLLSTNDFGLTLFDQATLPGDGQWYGAGIGTRYYVSSNKRIDDIYIGIDLDYMSSPNSNIDFTRLSVEVGKKYFPFSKNDGLFLCPQAMAYILFSAPKGFKEKSAYFTLSIGYQF